jgi:hypothetical protein
MLRPGLAATGRKAAIAVQRVVQLQFVEAAATMGRETVFLPEGAATVRTEGALRALNQPLQEGQGTRYHRHGRVARRWVSIG